MLDKRIVDCLSKTLKIDAAGITSDTAPGNTPAWDSIAHLNLVFDVEDAFGVRLSTEEIPLVTSAGKLEELLRARKVL